MLVLLRSVRQGQLQKRETVRRPLGAPPIAVTSVHCRGSSTGSYALRYSCCSARGVLVGQRRTPGNSHLVCDSHTDVVQQLHPSQPAAPISMHQQ